MHQNAGRMPRRPRICVPDTTLHVVQRGHNRARTFFAVHDYLRYLTLLKAACVRYQTQVHAYVLMTNHVHVLLTSSSADGVSRTMQHVGSRYVAAVNLRVGRTGTLWEGRFRSSPIDSEHYLLACYRYIELNPVRAGIVRHPGEYRWSSFSANVGAQDSPLITPHSAFRALGPNARIRAARYRALVEEGLDAGLLEEFRDGIRTGHPAGGEDFINELETSLARPVRKQRRGRRPGVPPRERS